MGFCRSEWVVTSLFICQTVLVIGDFEDESFQTVICTGADNEMHNNQTKKNVKRHKN